MESPASDTYINCDGKTVEDALLKTLAYFDVFLYPLREEELLLNYPSHPVSRNEMQQALEKLISKGVVNHLNGYYFLGNDKNKINRRIRGNIKAEKYMRKAARYSRLISKFPFVEAVFISGSLSKNYIDTDGDIDYFIITKPGRLWLARTLLIAFKKIVLLNSRKYFCVNYFVDSENLKITDQNVFTATELAYTLPMYNNQLCEAFLEANHWCREYYPNKPVQDTGRIHNQRRSLLKRITEPVFAGRLGDKTEAWCFRITQKHWKKKYKNEGENFFELNIRSRQYISKYHPQGFQYKVLERYNEKLRELGIAN